MASIQSVAGAIAQQIERVVFGKRDVVLDVLTCLFAGGHLLIEDVPGTAKTMLARALAGAVGGSFSRLQCTPDLLPSEVTGSSVFRQDRNEFAFHPGPVFSNILLADEINRATPRTQSALLEAMAEGQVSVDGVTHGLPRPFFVIATQNPVEHEGTFPLPEAQLDRFLMKISVGYPDRASEDRMLQGDALASLSEVAQVITPEQLGAVQAAVRRIAVHAEIRRYILDLADVTRSSDAFVLGAGPRATLGLLHAAQARAAISGRAWVLPDDVRALHARIFAHRIKLSASARLDRIAPGAAIADTARVVSAPAPRVGAGEHDAVATPTPSGPPPASDPYGAAPGSSRGPTPRGAAPEGARGGGEFADEAELLSPPPGPRRAGPGRAPATPAPPSPLKLE